jgi:peroxiredoxin
MARMDDLYTLPHGLPIPEDDGGAQHLTGAHLPPVPLRATTGGWVELAALSGRSVLFIYPRTGLPDQPPPAGWDSIPGARGCTPQACSFRDQHGEIAALGARVFGMSAQDTDYQREALERLHLPYPLLSDERLMFSRALRLPTFEVEGMTLLKRLTMMIRDGRIEHIFYPVFPPDRNADDVVAWLATHPR